MKILNFLVLMFLAASMYGQKITFDKKTNQVAVDGQNSFQLLRAGCGLGIPDCHLDVLDAAGKKVFRINYRKFKASNGTDIIYDEYVFLESGQKAEVASTMVSYKITAKNIVTNKLIVNGKLNEVGVNEFVLVHGTLYKDRIKF